MSCLKCPYMTLLPFTKQLLPFLHLACQWHACVSRSLCSIQGQLVQRWYPSLTGTFEMEQEMDTADYGVLQGPPQYWFCKMSKRHKKKKKRTTPHRLLHVWSNSWAWVFWTIVFQSFRPRSKSRAAYSSHTVVVIVRSPFMFCSHCKMQQKESKEYWWSVVNLCYFSFNKGVVLLKR